MTLSTNNFIKLHSYCKMVKVYIYRFSFSCPWVTICLHSRELNLTFEPQAVRRVLKILNLTLESGEIS